MGGPVTLPRKSGHGSKLPLREARKASGLTGAQVAERMGVSQVTVSQLEAGRTHPPAGTLYRFAVAVGWGELADVLRPIVETLPNGGHTRYADGGRARHSGVTA